MAAQLPPITSRENPVFKRVRSLQRSSVRNAERAFIVEGARALDDALQMGAVPELLLIDIEAGSTTAGQHYDDLHPRFIASTLFAQLSDTVAPQGLLAVFPLPEPATPLTSPELVLVADAISDPGNLGALLRSAAAAGVNEVLLTPGTVDPFNAKVVRAGMGAHFRVPIRRYNPKTAAGPGPKTLVALLSRDEHAVSFDQVDLSGPVWIVVGSEARGPGDEIRAVATTTVSIPMALATESLNAAVAGSIVLFEAVRQRKITLNSRNYPHKH